MFRMFRLFREFERSRPQRPHKGSFCLVRCLWSKGLWMMGLGLAVLWGGCTTAGQNGEPPTIATGCHPYQQGLCLLPYPSSFYLQQEEKTGEAQLRYPEVLPFQRSKGKPVQGALFSKHRGFSPMTPILAEFSGRVDPRSLIGSQEAERSLKPDSPVQLIEMETGARVAIFAEVDQGVKKQEDAQAVIVRVMVRLKPATRYAVVFLRSVKTTNGAEIASPAGFRWAREVDAAKAKLAPAPWPRVKELHDQTMQSVSKAGVDVAQVALAWSFQTAPDQPLLEEMLGMRETLFAALPSSGPSYKIEQTTEPDTAKDRYLFRLLQGTMQVPSFLTSDKDGEGEIKRDASGKPMIREQAAFPLQIHIPRCVLEQQGPVPIMVFGHGLFGGARSEMTKEFPRKLAQRLCMVQIGTDWIGMALADLGTTAMNILDDMGTMKTLVGRLQQAQMNFLALIRLAKAGLVNEPQLQRDGKPMIDPTRLYYAGFSNGAIQGGTLMALTPDIQRAALHVGGGGWTLLMSRSAVFDVFVQVLSESIASPIERQLYLAMLQPFFDQIDPITFAPYLKNEPQKLGVPAKTIMYHEAIGDALVNNLTTRLLMRTMQIPSLVSAFEPVYGLPQETGPLVGWGYLQFGPRPSPFPPDANIPAPVNSVHFDIRDRENVIQTLVDFLKEGGQIVSPCEGPCDPN